MPLPTEFNVEKFLAEIDKNPDMKGMRVVYVGSSGTRVLREGPPYCADGMQAVILRDATEQTALQVPAAAQARDSKILAEVLGAGLSCGAAVLGWFVVLGSAGAAPVTGGGSTFITYLAIGATGASSVQCVNGLGRVATEVYAPERLDVLDSEEWYQNTSIALDVLSLAGAVTAAAATVRLAMTLRATTGKSMTAVLKGLNRQQRKKLAEELIRSQNPGISNSTLKLMVSKGIYPKRFPSGAVPLAVRQQLLDAAGAAMSFVGSATSGVVRQGIVVGFGQAIDTH